MSYFTEDELKCRCGNCHGTMNSEFMEKLNALREHCAFPFVISSAYRCEEYNKKIGGAKNSAHVKGRAVDIVVSRSKALMLVSEATEFGFNGVGVQQRGSGRFIHIDDLHPDYNIWSY